MSSPTCTTPNPLRERPYGSINARELIRDFRSMAQFKMLASQDMVSVPLYAESDLGTEVGSETLEVGKRHFEITEDAAFEHPTPGTRSSARVMSNERDRIRKRSGRAVDD